MHELSLCENILLILQEQAGRQGYHRVKTVWLEIGTLSGVEPDALRFSFDAVMRDSLADHAALNIIEISGTAWCEPCGRTVEVEQRFYPCPHCGNFQIQVNGGEQMRIKQLEVE